MKRLKVKDVGIILCSFLFAAFANATSVVLAPDFVWDNANGLKVNLRDPGGKSKGWVNFDFKLKENWDQLNPKNPGAKARKENLKAQYDSLISKGLIDIDLNGVHTLSTSRLSPDFRVVPASREVQMRLISKEGQEKWVHFDPGAVSKWITNTTHSNINARHQSLIDQWNLLNKKGYIVKGSNGSIQSGTQVLSSDFRRTSQGLVEWCVRRPEEQAAGFHCPKWAEFNPSIRAKWAKSSNPREQELFKSYTSLLKGQQVDSTQVCSIPIEPPVTEGCLSSIGEVLKAADGPRLYIGDGNPFTDYYTRNYRANGGAYSDHGPIIFGKVGIWNIAQQGAEFKPQGRSQIPPSFNHKFINLKDESDSEYQERLTRIAFVLKKMFNSTQITTFLLQELPFGKLHKKFLDHLKRQLKPLVLQVDGGQGIVLRPHKPLKNDKMVISQKVITSLGLQKGSSEMKAVQKFSPFFNSKDNRVYISTHAPFDIKHSRLCEIMGEITRQARALHPAASVVFGGDFNHAASQLMADPGCSALGAKRVYSTPGEKGYSAGKEGDNLKNVDIMIEM